MAAAGRRRGLELRAARAHFGCVPQLPLFHDESRVLLDGASGHVRYVAGCMPVAQADAWFEQLRDTVPWRSQRRMMYEREVDVPRLTAHFALEDPALPDVIRAAADVVSAVARASFNSAGLNFYRDGNDSVAPHNDRLAELVAGAPIALLSLGATRRMTIVAKDGSHRPLHVDLDAGSVLVMDYASQLHFVHGVAKTRGFPGARISVAFRLRSRREAW